MSYKLISIIHEEMSDKDIYTVQRTTDLVLRDINSSTLTKCVDDLDNVNIHNGELDIPDDVQRINLWNVYNTGGKVISGWNDLETFCRKNGLEDRLESYKLGDNELDARKISRSSNKIIKIKCNKCGYEQHTKLNYYINRNSNSCVRCAAEEGNSAPYCIPGTNDLYTICKKEGKEYILDEYNDEINPHEISYGTDMKVKWKCKYGHTWEASPGVRLSKNTGCPYCKGSQTSKTERMLCNWFKENNISINEREKINEEEFDIVLVEYNILIEINSDHTHSIEQIRKKDANKIEIAKSLGKELIVLMQFCYPVEDNTLHYDISFRADKRNYIQKLTNELNKRLEQHDLKLNPISYDAIAKANMNNVPFERSLIRVYTNIEEYWSPNNRLSPEQIFANSRQYVKLICKTCVEEYEIRADAIKQSWNKASKGCPHCSGKKVRVEVNDLQTLEPEICLDWHPDNDISPTDVSVHSNKKVMWLCHKCGNVWDAMINNRTGVNRTGCPVCNQHNQYK